MKKKSSPTKKVKKKSKVKKSKTVVKIQKILKVKNKEKKLNLNKDELAKYSDENLREVALKMKNGCDCPENCFKSKFFYCYIYFRGPKEKVLEIGNLLSCFQLKFFVEKMAS